MLNKTETLSHIRFIKLKTYPDALISFFKESLTHMTNLTQLKL